jgi:exodeoxyribonuclease V beta subunit
MTYESVHDIHQIDLRQHGLIEASAGTGKTYTIENLMVRLLREQEDVELENILMVTFTEKASSELKIRIRERLEGALNDPDLDLEISKKLRLCVDEFDKAAIHTIHGFCQSVLRDFAFENRAPLQAEVVQDAPLYETLLKEQMRKEWPEKYGEDLQEVLELSRFNERKDRFLNAVIRLATSLHERAGDRLLPDLGSRDFKGLKAEIVAACMGVKADIRPGFSEGYGQLNFNATAKNNILEKIIVPVEGYFSTVEAETFDLRALSELMSQVEGTRSTGREGLDCLIPEKWNKGGPNLRVCPELAPVKEGLEEVSRRLKDLHYCLTVETVHRLQSDVALTKQVHGWISYYDMLALVETALYADNAGDLLKSLRARFKVAFIDEFQDTDPVQWRIFKKIFVDSPDECRNRLFVIGDPKQAIYAFRGADVYAYLTAKNEMEGLARKGKAGLYSLSVNWRSQPGLITTFNRLFGRESWFKPQAAAGPFDIGYQETSPPDPADARGQMIADDSGRPVLTIVDLRESPSPKPAKLRLARFVAREIQHLTASDIRIVEKGRGERSIGFGDIAILVRGKSDVPFLEDELKREKIPYAFYKKPGLFASDEAVYTTLVFHAILDPGDSSAVKKGLLTPFFGQQVQDLYGYEEMPPTHPVKEVLFKWNGYAMMRRWGYLFQSLMEDSGLLARGAGGMGWDRKYTNYRQIFEYLKEVAYRKNLDFRGLSAVLDLYRNASWEADEGVDIHQIETESGKVQIMTMHVSKGLQFPVVFVAGGLTQPMSHQEAYHVYHPIGAGKPSPEITRIIDLRKSGGGGRHELEKADEDRRLYYVAATRAQFKLYLPFYLFEKDASWLGPICTLLSPALVEAFSEDRGDRDVLWLMAGHPAGDLTTRVQSVRVIEDGGIPEATGFEDLLIPESYEGRRTRVHSFSSLHQEKARADDIAAEDISFHPPREGKEADEVVAFWEMGAVPKEGPPDQIPGGTDVGLMFHGILEHMDYSVVLSSGPEDKDTGRRLLEDPGTRDIILGQTAVYRMDVRWQEAICRILWDTLTATIPPLGDGFSLSRLKPEDRLHEAAFYFSASGSSGGPGSIAGRGAPNRFMRGFIDLIFRREATYYVADWKSNLLETGYDQASMAKSMADADYHLQYKLYAVAALRWLRQSLGDRFDPKKHWGGVFYFYLRGMGGRTGDGIYHVPAEKLGSLEQLEEEVGLILDS